MLKLFIDCKPQLIQCYWLAGDRAFSCSFDCTKPDGSNISIVEAIKWVKKNTPIYSADIVYIDCKEFNLLDQDFWKSWGIETSFEAWVIPDKSGGKIDYGNTSSD